MKISKKLLTTFVLGLGLTLTLTGCVKPYNKPKFVTIEPNETAFLLPLEGKTSDQKQFESVDFLQKNMVAAKRIQIPRKEIKVGRGYWKVKYIDTMRVIKVDRSPETREWTGKQAIKSESKDSIKFSTGISATSSILPEDAPKFLYTYSGKTLKDIMDKEIRNRLETKMIEEFSKLTMDEIRSKKADVINRVSDDVEKYFKERGITISNIGYKGDLVYADDAVQKAITAKFNAQNEYEAQQIINKTEVEKAEAEKKANAIRKQAMKEIMEMKELEAKLKAIEKWDGKFPDTLIIGGDSDSNLLFNIPAQTSEGK